MVSVKIEQRINLKFLVKLKKSATECYQLLKEVFGDNTMSRTCVFEWHRRFSEGREEVEDDERPGRPVTSRTEEKIQKVSEIVRKDRRLSIRMIADTLSGGPYQAEGTSEEEETRFVEEQLVDPPSGQRSRPQCPLCEAVFDGQAHSCA